MTVVGGNYEENTASTSGGAIKFDGNQFTVSDNAEFEGNEAGSSGGGIEIRGEVVIKDIFFAKFCRLFKVSFFIMIVTAHNPAII
ncbi:MAG: hypothetical protein U5L04_05725 [Trueperaceae bacterium]|nr:hypothetical protein [Trueperaceae bacterium]